MVDEQPQPDLDAVPDAGPQDTGTPTPPVAHVADADDLPAWSSSIGDLHLASGADSDGVAARDDEVSGLLLAADRRDAAAGARDREARRLPPEDLARLAGIFREWAARDRDLAAADRADLISLLRLLNRHERPRPR